MVVTVDENAWLREVVREHQFEHTLECGPLLRIERDAFTTEGGYPAGLSFGGVPVRDRVWLEMPL